MLSSKLKLAQFQIISFEYVHGEIIIVFVEPAFVLLHLIIHCLDTTHVLLLPNIPQSKSFDEVFKPGIVSFVHSQYIE